MARPHRMMRVFRAAALASALGLASQTSPARAERQHTVAPGQSLDVIAKQYKLSPSALAAANGLERNSALRRGQVLTVPPQGVVIVGNGQTLGHIALEHKLTVAALAKANHITPESTLRVGQRLLLPGYQPGKRESAAEQRWGRPKQRGQVTLYRLWSGETEKIQLVDSRGRTRLTARWTMRQFLRPRDSKKRKLPNARLLSLLAQVSDHFGGRPIHVVSGYRLPGGLTRSTSRHVAGEAIDFRIPGVPLTELRDYCSHFENVGVGFYPRTEFVHLDVRVKPARWTDWSLPGQPAILEKPDDIDESASDRATAPTAPSVEVDMPEPEEVQRPQ